MQDTCFVRLELLTLEMEVESDNCVHDRVQVMGGKEMSGALCGDRSGEVVIVEVEDGRDINIVAQVQSKEWRWNIGITQVEADNSLCFLIFFFIQISCEEVEKVKQRYHETDLGCGKKNPSV